MVQFTIAPHPEFKGYLNITALFRSLVVGEAVTAGAIEIDPQSLPYVAALNADTFDDDECPSVLLQVVEEHVNALTEWTTVHTDDYLVEGTIDSTLAQYWADYEAEQWMEENHSNLMGHLSGFIGDDSLYLGV